METKIFIISSLIFSLVLTNSPIMSLAQIKTPCSPSMLSSVTGCMDFLTGSSGNSSPTSGCCGALKSLTGIGMDCLCLIVTAQVPINLPINRSLAISLPRACGMSGVPVQCKASAAPLPAPGPASLGPTTFPTDDSQSPEGPASFGPTTSPTPSINHEDDYPTTDEGGDGTTSTPTSASLPSSSHYSLKLLLLLFAFVNFF